MNKTHFLCLRTDAQEGKKTKITDVEKLEKFLQLQAACPWKNNRVGTGIFPINSNRNLHSNTSITIQCNVHVYLHIHISGVLANAPWAGASTGRVR